MCIDNLVWLAKSLRKDFIWLHVIRLDQIRSFTGQWGFKLCEFLDINQTIIVEYRCFIRVIELFYFSEFSVKNVLYGNIYLGSLYDCSNLLSALYFGQGIRD